MDEQQRFIEVVGLHKPTGSEGQAIVAAIQALIKAYELPVYSVVHHFDATKSMHIYRLQAPNRRNQLILSERDLLTKPPEAVLAGLQSQLLSLYPSLKEFRPQRPGPVPPPAAKLSPLQPPGSILGLDPKPLTEASVPNFFDIRTDLYYKLLPTLMEKGMFDTNDILGGTYENANDTEVSLPPPGTYVGTIVHDPSLPDEPVNGSKRITARRGESKNDDGTTRPWMLINVPFRLKDTVNPESPVNGRICRMTIFLDLVTNPDGSVTLDFGPERNIGLGRLREAVGQNQAGEAWSIHNLAGQSCQVEVAHEASRKEEGRFYANVVKVAPLS